MFPNEKAYTPSATKITLNIILNEHTFVLNRPDIWGNMSSRSLKIGPRYFCAGVQVFSGGMHIMKKLTEVKKMKTTSEQRKKNWIV